jgi:hypothetical protein
MLYTLDCIGIKCRVKNACWQIDFAADQLCKKKIWYFVVRRMGGMPLAGAFIEKSL